MTRSDILEFLKKRASFATGEPSPIRGGRAAAMDALAQLDVEAYARSRNYTDGAVTRMSPYIRHGVLGLADVRDAALERADDPKKFVQQLAWRDYWRRYLAANPDAAWENVEDYKTGFTHDDYADDLPEDIVRGQTGVAAIDDMIAPLLTEGWMHNHTRLYVAAYVVHWRRVKWQAGARWFLAHLLDGDVASNNLSWQWVASTFAAKPYYFNLENVERFADNTVNTRYHDNKVLAGTYEDLAARLFPNVELSS